MIWPFARASTWLREYADDVASDAYHHDGDEVLYAAAGAAYYAVRMGIGYNTKQEFIDFWHTHLKLDDDFLQEAIEEIER